MASCVSVRNKGIRRKGGRAPVVSQKEEGCSGLVIRESEGGGRGKEASHLMVFLVSGERASFGGGERRSPPSSFSFSTS